MTRRAYRITQTKFADTAFDGEGAKRFGGRWNSEDTPVVYVASSLSLATLELLVHIDDISTIYDNYCVIPVDMEEELIETLDPKRLPDDWDAPEPISETQLIGDEWVARGSSIVLCVPSAVTRGEVNYLLHPHHPDFSKLAIGPARPFEPDTRLEP